MKPALWHQPIPDLTTTTDNAGLAVFSNLPDNVKEFTVEHDRFDIPAITRSRGGKHRNAELSLTPGMTNHITVRLEPRAHSPITHY